jgi:hypothetical protein
VSKKIKVILSRMVSPRVKMDDTGLSRFLAACVSVFLLFCRSKKRRQGNAIARFLLSGSVPPA